MSPCQGEASTRMKASSCATTTTANTMRMPQKLGRKKVSPRVGASGERAPCPVMRFGFDTA